MSSFTSALLRGTYSQIWHLFDAKWQNPFQSAVVIAEHLQGKHKPLNHSFTSPGDVVVVINCRHIVLHPHEWRRQVYFHHSGCARGESLTLAWELHERSPTMIMEKAVYTSLKGNLKRANAMKRLLVYPDNLVPGYVLKNISSEIKQLKKVPKILQTDDINYIINFPVDYVPS